ncbi:hypothetical protein [Paenibacillus wenxiniae]|uniref:Cytoplasmic protein n=1 Tax=Paenibacillus wenxiniae TaxID=1636843 RepID=A0ABW4RFY3_9BACL
MKYGKYKVLVEEVFEIARKMNNKVVISKPNNIVVMNKYSDIEKYAFDEIYGEDEYTWSDIRQLEAAEIKGKLYELDIESKPEGLDDLTEVIANILRESIPDEYSDFFENVVVDLKNCALNRAVNGKIDNFYEIILQIYNSGGFPCGWQGNYPDEGKIVAYYESTSIS